MRFVAAVIVLMSLALTGCSGAAYDCLFAGYATVTPLVQLPTATPDAAATETPMPTGTPCPTPTPTIIPSAQPTATRGAWLGESSGQLRRVAQTPGDETLLGLSTDHGLSLVWWRTGDGQVGVAEAMSDSTSPAHYSLGSADAAVLVAGPTGVAALLRRSMQVTWRVADRLDGLPAAPDQLLPWGGDDLAAAYGPEGWLYAAAAGQIARFNPFAKTWEFDGNYSGQAQQMLTLASGAMLLLTDRGLYRRDGDWRRVWDVDAVQVPRVPDGREAPRSVAVAGDRLAMAWVVAQGYDPTVSGQFDLSDWRVTESADGGQTWSAPEIIAAPANDEDYTGLDGGWYGDCAAIYRADGTLEVVGLYAEIGRGQIDPALSYPVVVRREAGGWFPRLQTPQPQSLLAADEVQPGSNLRAVSGAGQTWLAWEARGFNGKDDIQTLSR